MKTSTRILCGWTAIIALMLALGPGLAAHADNPAALVWGTYMGDTDEDLFTGMVLDSAGNPIVVGETSSSSFPTTAGAYDTTHNGGRDAFIAKFDAVDGSLIFSTLIGGTGGESFESVTVDDQGNIYALGTSDSSDFPTTPGSFDTTYNAGPQDLVVCKFDPSGATLLQSTYVGGADEDQSFTGCIRVDASYAAYITGFTQSPDFPVTAGAYSTTKSGPAPPSNTARDAFVAKLTPDGSALEYATFLGGTAGERALGFWVNSLGEAYVCGNTNSSDFPTTAGAYQTAFGGISDAFVTKLNATGSALIYSTFLGGSDNDQAWGIVVDSTGVASVSGPSRSADFPTTPGAYSATISGTTDVMVARISPAGDALIAATLIGGEAVDFAHGIDLDACGNIFVSLETFSSSFPVTPDAFQSSYGGARDGAIAKFSDDLTTLLYGSYVGGTGDDNSAHIRVDNAGYVYVWALGTTSLDYPTTPDAFDPTFNGDGTLYDGGIVKLAIASNLEFTGFLPPIGGADATGGSFEDPVRAFKLKSTIPVKFSATGCEGEPVVTGVHTLQAIKYSSATTSEPAIDATPTDAATTGNQFRLTDEEWHFNLSTKTGFSQGTWLLIATLSDGSTHSAWIAIKN